MKFSNAQIDFMRYEIENNFPHTRFIENTRKRIESEGRDFDAELEHYQKTGELVKIPSVSVRG